MRRAAQRRREADALRAFANAITHARAAHGDGADAGHDLTLGQMPVADQPLTAVLGQLARRGLASKAATSASTAWANNARAPLRRAHLGQPISKSSWLGELENV